jgi:hypothetical protein
MPCAHGASLALQSAVRAQRRAEVRVASSGSPTTYAGAVQARL